MKREDLCIGDRVICNWYKTHHQNRKKEVTIMGFIDGGARCAVGGHSAQVEFEDILNVVIPSHRRTLK